MELLDRVRTTIARHALARPARAWSSPCPADPIRWRSPICCARSPRPASCELVGLAHLNHQLRDAADGRRAFLPAIWRATWAFRCARTRPMSARLPAASGVRSRTRRTSCATSFSTRARVHFRADCRRARPHARRPGRDVSAPAGARRRGARARRHASAPRRDHPAAARLPARRAARLPGRAEASRSSTTRRMTTSAFRATGCAPSCCRCLRRGSIRGSSTCWPTRRRLRGRSGGGCRRSADGADVGAPAGARATSCGSTPR